MEGEGSSETEVYTESLDNSIIFHVIKSILGFILYMHQQIPSVLQDISMEFDSLKEEYKEMVTVAAPTDGVAASINNKRKHMSRMREVRVRIKRFEKLINSVTGLETALQLIITEIPTCLESFILILGPSPLRAHQVYQLSFSHGNNSLLNSHTGFAKTKAAEAFSRKVIRALISKGAGSASYPGPTKLFLLVKAPSCFNLALHFLPKRDFRFSKKIVPVKLRVKSKSQNVQTDAPDCSCQDDSSISLADSATASHEFIWFQCRHVVKGLSFKTPTEE